MPVYDNPVSSESDPGGRYARQAVLRTIGRPGQETLAGSTVLIVGCGALGSAQAEFLARAGVGGLVLVDRDVLELHNLQRQFLFDEHDVRERLPKAEAAARRLQAINSEISIQSLVTDVTASNIEELVKPVDLVLDGTDNIETRYLVNDATVAAGKPWIYGGVIETHGTVMAVRPGYGPCFRCIFPDPPDPGRLPTCETQGVLNTAVAWVAALQSTEAIRLLTEDQSGEFRLHALDIWRGTVTSFEAKRNDECICCGKGRFEFLNSERGSSSTVFCGRNAVQVTPERRTMPDFERIAERLSPFGLVTVSGLLLEFTCDHHRLVLFPDGRVLVMGTKDTAEARGLVAKYIGS